MEKIIKYEIGENKIKFSRNYQGIWTAEFSIYCQDIFDGVSLGTGIIDYIDKELKEKNQRIQNAD